MSKHQPTVFNQLFWIIRDHVNPFIGQLDKYAKVFDCKSLLKVLLYAQISGKVSLRDIEVGLQSHEDKLYHLGIKSTAHSTISYWNNKVDSSVFENLFYTVFNNYKSLCIQKNKEFPLPCVALDSTLISLSVGLFDRAKHRTTKGGIRVHVGLELDKCIPRFAVIRDAKQADNIIAREVVKNGYLNKGELIVFDRYYVDFRLRDMIDKKNAFFVTRTKRNMDYVIMEKHNLSDPFVTMDASIELLGAQGLKNYPKRLRVVRFYDQESQREFEYITNNTQLSAGQIADIYKNRRRIEEFFKRMKQNLKIKSFLGTSQNAVMNQIRVAMIYYLITHYLSYISSLGKQQILKLLRLLRENCMRGLGLSEIFCMCKSKSSICLSNFTHPPGTLFDF